MGGKGLHTPGSSCDPIGQGHFDVFVPQRAAKWMAYTISRSWFFCGDLSILFLLIRNLIVLFHKTTS
ncbi:hypothetical protein V6N11_057071 [Hibiscus sabdariffa]|uniref:Uncharacterized protein n=1 Tax=Hibiscus sabdariffa TaxID=183260 RepID=A0ABR1ZVV1_9ROSI